MQLLFHAGATTTRFSETMFFCQLPLSRIISLAHSAGSDSSPEEEILLNPSPLALQYWFLTLDCSRQGLCAQQDRTGMVFHLKY